MSIVERLHSPKSLETWIVNWLVRELQWNEAAIERNRPFLSYGMNSIQAMMLVGDLEHALDTSLPPTLVWDHPSIEILAGHLAELVKSHPGGDSATERKTGGGLNSVQAKALLARLDEFSDDQIEELLRQMRQ